MRYYQKSNVFRLLFCLLMFFSVCFGICAADAFASQEKVLGEIKNDKALVYFIYKADAQLNKIEVFDGEKVLTVLKKNSYSYAYLEPGKHFIWWDGWYGNQIEFVPGCTYYFDMDYPRHTLLNEKDGLELVKKLKYYVIPKQKEINKATKYIKHHYAKALDREKQVGITLVGDISPQPAQPIQEAGAIKVPAYTQIKLQLVENISSVYNHVGETVWFQIAEDVKVNNEVCFPSGTLAKGYIRQCESAAGFGLSGFLDVVITEILTNQGTNVSLIGRLINSGKSRGNAASGMSAAFGLIGAAMTRGKNCVELSGSSLIVWTRYDLMIVPKKNKLMDGPVNKDITIKVDPLTVNEKWLTQKKEDDLLVKLKCSKPVKEIKISGNKFCSKLDQKGRVELSKVAGESKTLFRLWEIIRYVDFNTPVNQIELSGKYIDDQPFVTELQVNIENK